MRYAQLVMGPAGSGKSKYCTTMLQHAENCQRIVNVINLDPAAEYFEYNPVADIRDLIHLDDVMEDEELNYGPNGGLVYCMEYLLDNLEWLEENIGEYEDDYLIFDCPGQLELYTHLDTMKNLLKALNNWNFRVCGVFLMDAQFMVEGSKFLSGTMSALSVMVNLEIPHVNILSKMDLLDSETRKNIERFLVPDSKELIMVGENSKWNSKYLKLIEAIGKLIDDYSMVRFLPLDISDEESIEEVLMIIDNAIQYGEDLDVKTHEFDLPDDD